MAKKTIEVLVVDDSPTARELISFIIHQSDCLHVIGTAENGEKALEFLKYKIPDVITMDIMMPKLDGFETTRRIMEKHPIPIIIISSNFDSEDVAKSFKAIEAGSVAILEKPRGIQDPRFPLDAKNIIETIINLSDVKLVTRRHEPLSQGAAAKPLFDHPEKQIRAIAIGASLGGPQALQAILSELPESLEAPIFIAQHISQGFIGGLIDWLSSATRLQVLQAANGQKALPGQVLIAPDGTHLTIAKGNIIHLQKENSLHAVCPSISKLFQSVADAHGPNAIGILLTGMGRDGVHELKIMKDKGAITIAQAEEGCIMYGMPKEAIESGAVKHVLPLNKIASTLKMLTRSSASTQPH